MEAFHTQYKRRLWRTRADRCVDMALKIQAIEDMSMTGENVGGDAREFRKALDAEFQLRRRAAIKFQNVEKSKEARQSLREKELSTASVGADLDGIESAAPEVAAEEDDGDGDGDPDPERQTKRRIARPLPPAQLSRPKAACALLGIGRTKLWQLSEQDPRFPRKIVLGPRCVGWRTDALIGYLRTLEQEA